MIPVILILLAALAVQLPLSLLVKRRMIHWIPTGMLSLVAGALFIMALTGEGWDVLGYLFLSIYVALGAAGTLLTLIIVEIVKAIRRRRRKTPEEPSPKT